jgi:FMN reductase
MKIVALGGTYREGSSTERCLGAAIQSLQALGAETVHLGAQALDLPMYRPDAPDRSPRALAMLAAVREADGLIVATPAYHAGISGLVKNALDYFEDLRDDPRPYLHGRPVGCIVTGAGWQAGAVTLTSLRAVVHALRGWPTPLGVVVNTSEVKFDDQLRCNVASVGEQLRLLSSQVIEFAGRWAPA